jgi:hypothetical protein
VKLSPIATYRRYGCRSVDESGWCEAAFVVTPWAG